MSSHLVAGWPILNNINAFQESIIPSIKFGLLILKRLRVIYFEEVSKKLVPLLFLIVYSLTGFTQNADINLLKSINLNRSKNLDPFFRALSNTTYPLSLAIPVALYGKGYFTNDSLTKRQSIQVGAALVVTTFVTEALKYSINRVRPFISYPFIEKAGEGDDPSFPSGHVSIAFATSTSLCLLNHRWYVVIPSLLWASSIAYARMDLGVHYPSDVLAGALIGSASAFLCYKANKWLVTRRIFRRLTK